MLALVRYQPARTDAIFASVIGAAVLLLRRRSTGTAVRMLAAVLVAVVSGAGAIAITGSGSFLQERAAL